MHKSFQAQQKRLEIKVSDRNFRNSDIKGLDGYETNLFVKSIAIDFRFCALCKSARMSTLQTVSTDKL